MVTMPCACFCCPWLLSYYEDKRKSSYGTVYKDCVQSLLPQFISSANPGEPLIHVVTKADLELLIHPPLPPLCYDFRHIPPCLLVSVSLDKLTWHAVTLA